MATSRAPLTSSERKEFKKKLTEGLRLYIAGVLLDPGQEVTKSDGNNLLITIRTTSGPQFFEVRVKGSY